MLTPRFERLFQRLLTAFVAYDDAPRTVDRLPELAVARTNLDRVRSEIGDERHAINEGLKRPRPVRKIAISDDDMAVLRVHGTIAG